MAKAAFRGDTAKSKAHEHTVAALSENSGIPVESVRILYEKELSILDHEAKIKDYLPILISKKLKSVLRN